MNMPSISKTPFGLGFVNKKPPSPSVGGSKVPSTAPVGSYFKNGHLFNKQGQRINAAGQRVDSSGRAINDKGRLINDKGQLINAQGKLINDKGHLIDNQGRLVNGTGRLVNADGHLIDRDGKLVNRDGVLVDKVGRPLDKDGKIARDKTSAVKGNNEAHEQLLPPSITQQMIDWKNKIPKPVSPPKMTIAEATARMMDAEKMIKSGVIPSSPSAAQVARDAAISAGITGVVSAPINIAAYAGSTAASEQIKAAYVPQPMIPPTPSAKSSIDRPDTPQSPDLTRLYPRMNDAQVTAFTVANQSMALKYGDTQSGFVPNQNWSKDPLERMTQLEELLDFAEEHTKEVADVREVFFKPHLANDPAAAGMEGLEARLGTIEKRISKLSQAQANVLQNLSQSTGSE
ncbi:DUF3659 domain-containing protein [Pseudomonas sp. EYE_354]|uniref:DUF3659 domain-containing protein n=1 Tax=Pseudomonas sp. EYE_354 TaxID=2853449 RepID=UPI002003D29F|nr:DUF3659 domain-containing protein [Pseudomonas sp. EYE_354]MCK6187915.1 hypothetical protein [Pseudomonas sp. EYE_354]